jgi:hypothetical protein
MSTTPVTLDDIRAAAEKKYASFPIQLDASNKVELVNPLRLNKAARKTMTDLQTALGEDDADQEELLGKLLVTVAATPGQGNKLVKAIGGDLTVLATIFEQYTEAVQAGEASASQV